jgi:hypothetical protein
LKIKNLNRIPSRKSVSVGKSNTIGNPDNQKHRTYNQDVVFYKTPYFFRHINILTGAIDGK